MKEGIEAKKGKHATKTPPRPAQNKGSAAGAAAHTRAVVAAAVWVAAAGPTSATAPAVAAQAAVEAAGRSGRSKKSRESRRRRVGKSAAAHRHHVLSPPSQMQRFRQRQR